MIRFFQLLGDYTAIPLIPNTAEHRPAFVNEREGLDSTMTHESQNTLQDSSPSLGSYDSCPAKSRVVEQGNAATFQDAHHFSISGNARIVNIGQQNFNNRGSYGLVHLNDFVSFSALHDSSSQDPERCCHPGTRINVLNQMRTWIDDPTAPERILWQHGPAGVGKSAIAQTLSYSYGRDKIAATFFFFRTDPLRNDGNRLLPTLAWQLASSIPLVKDLIAFTLDEYPDIPRKTIEIQFDQLIARPLLTISSGESTLPTSMPVIIIDGLDECSDVKLQERILKIIGNAVADTRFPLRFLISSRPEAHIQDFFDQFKSPTLQIDLAKVEDSFRDIKIYLVSEFARIAVEQQLDPDAWPDRGMIDALVAKSSGQFVYASTVMKYVGDKYESAIAQLNVVLGLRPNTGRSPFSELDALYIEILQRQPDKSFLKEFLSVLIARSMLAAVNNAKLHEDDATLLGVDEKQLYRKLRGMRSVLKFEPSIDVHHKSFLDFLDDSSRSGEYHVSKQFANMRYMQRIMDLLVNAASRVMDKLNSHEDYHFQPKFTTVTARFPFPIKLPLDDLEEILQPLERIRESLLQLPNMSVYCKPACEECWIFPMIDDLRLHLVWFRGAVQIQEQKYVDIRPLTAAEDKQSVPQLDLDTCLSFLLTNLRDAELSLNPVTIDLMQALVCFDPTEIVMKVRSMTDAQNLVELIFCLNKNECFKSWSEAASHKATRLAVEIYGRVPLLPRSLFLNSTDLNIVDKTYQGKAVYTWPNSDSVRHHFLDVFLLGSLSHHNLVPFLGICSDPTKPVPIISIPEHGLLQERTDLSISEIQLIVSEVANAVQYLHSLDFALRFRTFQDHLYLDSDNHAKLNCFCLHPNFLSDRQLKDYCYTPPYTLEDNVRSFGEFFYWVLFIKDYDETLPKPEIPDNIKHLIRRCRAGDSKECPTMDQVVSEIECWISNS